MRLAIFAFSRRGVSTARWIRQALAGGEWRMYAPLRLAEGEFSPVTKPLTEFTGPVFLWADAVIFVSSCGIAVRAIAPHVRDKTADPAVIAVDETAKFAVPLLSGHIGGANRLAQYLSAALDAVAVVTTATDTNGRFSVDAWATERGLHIDSLKAAKAVSAAILESPVPLKSDFPITGGLPPGVICGENGPVGVCISWRKQTPFGQTLLLVPKVVRLGIGCRKGIGMTAIAEAVQGMLDQNSMHAYAVKSAASIDLKKDERGLLEFCEKAGLPVDFYPAEELRKIEGAFTPSEFVQSVTGVDNVCERAALMGGGELIIKKTAGNGVTVAAAVEDWEVRFG